MRIFTYCSSRSSHYGFQYSFFDSSNTEKKQSLLSSEKDKTNAIPKTFIKWCEDYNGWQLVLLQNNKKDQFLLMAGQLEKSRELEKKKQQSIGNYNTNLNYLDSDYYMNLGFLGSASEIIKLAVFMLKEYKKDGYQDLFNRLEKTIQKSIDSTRYEVNSEMFNSIFNSIPNSSPMSITSNNQKNLFSRITHRATHLPSIYLSVKKAKSQNEILSIRKKNVEKCIELLSDFNSLSENVPLLIAYDYFKYDAPINIRIDYEYLW